jgi:hypothetical protein
MPTQPLRRRLLLIGWDAADWKVIQPLVDAGKMPRLQRLIECGIIGDLSSLFPPLSPLVWTSIATGKRPCKHGILGFTEPTPGAVGVRPVTNLGRQTRAVWNMLHLEGLTSNVVGWWPSHPAEPIRGVMVSERYHRAHGPLDKPWPLAPHTVHPERLWSGAVPTVPTGFLGITSHIWDRRAPYPRFSVHEKLPNGSTPSTPSAAGHSGKPTPLGTLVRSNLWAPDLAATGNWNTRSRWSRRLARPLALLCGLSRCHVWISLLFPPRSSFSGWSFSGPASRARDRILGVGSSEAPAGWPDHLLSVPGTGPEHLVLLAPYGPGEPGLHCRTEWLPIRPRHPRPGGFGIVRPPYSKESRPCRDSVPYRAGH